MKTSCKIAIVIASVFGIGGCTSEGPDEAQRSVDPMARDDGPANTEPPQDEGSSVTSTPETDTGSLEVERSPDVGATVEAITAAVNAMTAFCRPSLGYRTWIGELSPFLTQQAAVTYGTVDPANVPCTTLTGDARIRDGDGTFTIRVLVPTDAGEYSIYVHRTTDAAPWGIGQITPLASE